MAATGWRGRRWVALLLAPVTVAAQSVLPASAVAATVAAISVAAVVHAKPALAQGESVLILSTSVSGGSSSAEAQAASKFGATVTVATPSTWDAMTTAQFKSYSALVIGDPTSGGSCAASVPSGALSTAATWGPAVSGNVSVLGTAPVLAGSAGGTLLSDGIGYALAGSGTGLYMSLNCEYSTASAGTSVPLLANVAGGGFAVTGQGSSCPSNAGTVNAWASVADTQFNGLTNGAIGPWPSPACSVEETFTAWPAGLGGLAYDHAGTPAVFTASDGAAGQAYVLAGALPSAATAALAPSNGGEVPADAAAGGGGNPAAPGLVPPTAGDPVDPENGDFAESDTDLTIPTFGPDLTFARSYDAQLAQQQTESGTPGPMGYGWTDNWATSLTSGVTTPGDIYTVDGLATNTGTGGPALKAAMNFPVSVHFSGGDTYIIDTLGNRVQEVPGTAKSQWGISMTAGDVYTIAGSDTGASGDSPNGTPNGQSRLSQPTSVALDNAGDLYIADASNNRIVEIPAASGTQWGISMTADDLYTVAGNSAGAGGTGADGKAATSSDLGDPTSVYIGGNAGGNLYIADSANDRIQMVSPTSQTLWGQPMTADDVYTVAGSAAGNAGDSGDGKSAASALLLMPADMCVSSAGDLYIADSLNNRIQEVAKASGTEWGIPQTANDIYTIAGSAAGNAGTSGNGTAATSALLNDPSGIDCTGSTNLIITDSADNEIQEVPSAATTAWNVSMSADKIYTITGSTSGTQGFSGNGSAAVSALLDDPQGAAAIDSAGDLVFSDTENDQVRGVSTSTFNIFDYAGGAGSFLQDGDGGTAVNAGLSVPMGIAADSAGDVFIADTTGNRVQEIAASSHTQFGISMTAGGVYTVAGSAASHTGRTGDGGVATRALLSSPVSVAVDGSGNLYIDDDGNCRIQEVSASTDDILTIAGSATGKCGDSGDGGPAISALLDTPDAIAVDSAGDLFIADEESNQVFEVPAATGNGMTAGDIYTIAGSTSGAFGTSGDGGPATSGLLDGPGGVAVDAARNVYISDSGNDRIQEIAAATHAQWGQAMAKGDIYTIAGSPAGSAGDSGDGGPATSAKLGVTGQIALDSSGDLYLTDQGDNQIREVAAASGTQWGQPMSAADIYTVAGNSGGTAGSSGDGGAAVAALLDGPDGIGTDPAGDLFITDSDDNRLREVTATADTPLAASPVTENPSAGGIVISQPGGAQVTFYPKGSGGCPGPYTLLAGGYCTLPQNVATTLTYSPANGGTYAFSPSPGLTYTYGSSGALESEADSVGDVLTITFAAPAPGSGNCPSAASTCDTITSASGRALVLGMNNAGVVTSAADPMGRTWTYGYTGSDLTSATDPMGNVTSYAYGAGSTGNALLANDLLTITGPNAQPGGPDAGKATVNVYDSAGRVTSQTDPSGFETTFNYCVSAASGNCMDAVTGTGYVSVTDPDGNVVVSDFVQGALAAQSSWTGGTTFSSELDYVPDTTAAGSSGGTLLDTTATDGAGDITNFTFNAEGNLTAVSGPGANDSPATTTSAYTSALQDQTCDGTAEAAVTATCAQDPGPPVVTPGGVITPPSSAPPDGLTYSLDDADGNELYSTTGVYEPGATSAAYSQTSYQLFNGNTVTLPGTNNPISCTANAPSMSLPCATIDANGVVTQLAYDAQGDVTSTSAPDGNGSQQATSTATYNADGEELTEVAPDGHLPGANAGNYTTATDYNADGQETSVTEGGGTGNTDTPRTASFGYDADGNQITVKDPRGYTTTTAFNAGDKPVLVTNPDGNSTLTCYDGAGQVAQTVPATGVAANNLTAASCPTSYPAGYTDRLAADATTRTFNADGYQTAIAAPAPAGQSGPQTATVTYDGAGDPLTITAPPASNGGPAQVTADAYNSDGDLTSQTTGSGTPAAAKVSYCYDPNGDTTSMVYADGNVNGTASCETSSPWEVSATAYPTQAGFQTTYAYDSAGDLISTTTPPTAAAPSGATTTSTYDPDGNLLTSTDPDGVKTTQTYTPLGSVASVSYSGSSAHSVTYTYDADGNRTGMTDATGSSGDVYDSFGELTSTQNGAGKVTGYGYNADGQVTGVTYPLPSAATWATTDTVSYGYDNADEPTSVTDFNGNKITIGNTADGLPNSAALGSTGDTIATSYDNADRPSAISLKNSSSALESFTYSDAPAGNILSETDTPSSSRSPVTYTYDAKGRVSSMTAGSGAPLDYSFDASGNLMTLPGGATGTYDQAGELTSAVQSGATTSYTYNADGEQLTAAQGGTTVASGTWNGAGQLTSYSSSAGDMTAATYDGNGDRATAATGSGTQGFVWDTVSPVPQMIMDSANAYIYTHGPAPAEQVSLSSGTVTYLTADALGSVRGTVNSSGSLTGSTSYDAWGNPQTAGGLTATTPFGYAGGYTDPDDLTYLLNRYYEPAIGQFTSVDPDLAETQAPYSYAAGDPVSDTDPTGLKPWYEYETFKSLTILTSNEDYDFSAIMSKEVARTINKVGGHLVKLSIFLGSLAQILAAIIQNHPEIAIIVGAVAAFIGLVGLGLRKFYKIIKEARKKASKPTKDGFWGKSHFSGRPFGTWDYQHWYSRTCTRGPGKKGTYDRCGSPGTVNQLE